MKRSFGALLLATAFWCGGCSYLFGSNANQNLQLMTHATLAQACVGNPNAGPPVPSVPNACVLDSVVSQVCGGQIPLPISSGMFAQQNTEMCVALGYATAPGK